jgi:hypothetical protein
MASPDFSLRIFPYGVPGFSSLTSCVPVSTSRLMGRREGQNFGPTGQPFVRGEEENHWPVGPGINFRLIPSPRAVPWAGRIRGLRPARGCPSVPPYPNVFPDPPPSGIPPGYNLIIIYGFHGFPNSPPEIARDSARARNSGNASYDIFLASTFISCFCQLSPIDLISCRGRSNVSQRFGSSVHWINIVFFHFPFLLPSVEKTVPSFRKVQFPRYVPTATSQVPLSVAISLIFRIFKIKGGINFNAHLRSNSFIALTKDNNSKKSASNRPPVPGTFS